MTWKEKERERGRFTKWPQHLTVNVGGKSLGCAGVSCIYMEGGKEEEKHVGEEEKKGREEEKG